MTEIINKRWGYDRRDEHGKIVWIDIEILPPASPNGLPRRSAPSSKPQPTEVMSDSSTLQRILRTLRRL